MEETLPLDKSKKQTQQPTKLELIHDFLSAKEKEKGGPISDRMRRYFQKSLEKEPKKSLEDVWRQIYG